MWDIKIGRMETGEDEKDKFVLSEPCGI